jgi:putative sugar O-methyltransferase
MNLNLLKDNFKAAIDHAKNLNHKSIHWNNFFNEKNFNNFLVDENLINFRKNQILSKGLDDSHNMTNKIKLEDYLNEFNENFLTKNLASKNVGNSNNSSKILNLFYDYGELCHLEYFKKFEERISNKSIICEIGAGYGNLARIIMNNFKVKIILIDLPQANLLQSYYLMNFFPNSKLYLYKDYLKEGYLSKESIDKYDIFILPPNLKMGDQIKIDLFINTKSLMEMDYEMVKYYFDIIQKNISINGCFFNLNKYMHFKSSNWKNSIWDFPYDKNWDVISSEPMKRQPQLHALLTKREYKNFNDNILTHLQKLKVSNGQNYAKKSFYIKQKLINKVRRIIYLILRKLINTFLNKKYLKKIIIFLQSVYQSKL